MFSLISSFTRVLLVYRSEDLEERLLWRFQNGIYKEKMSLYMRRGVGVWCACKIYGCLFVCVWL